MWTQTFLVVVLAAVVQGSYVITTPRRWKHGQSNTVCLYHVRATGRADDGLKITVKDGENATVASVKLPVEQGQTSKCYPVEMPPHKDNSYSYRSTYANTIIFEGKVGEDTFKESRELYLEVHNFRTFVQTDKYLYQPGQLVRFRILTLTGENARVSTDNYPSIYVETPSGTRIKQWLDVDNTRGLVHQEFQLSQEAEEGQYSIIVSGNIGSPETQWFKVEEYVPPKFEVTVTPPDNIYGTDSEGSVKVCAEYTFGQPVKGNATVVFGAGYSRNKKEVTKSKLIEGCGDFVFTFEELDLNGEFVRYGIHLTATVVEDGTDTEISSSSYISILRSAIRLNTDTYDNFIKPGLPATVRINATKANGAAAAFEPIQVCLRKTCKNFTTDSNGLFGFHVPYNALGQINGTYDLDAEITCLGYPEIKKENGSFIMRASTTNVYFKPYYSPTNSSLLLRVPDGELDCKEEGHQLQLDLMFSVFQQDKANITVQVISRGQIRYQNTAEYSLLSSPLPLDYEFLTPTILPEGVVVGSVKIPVSLRGMDTPEAKVLVWYSRDDGEVVSAIATLDVRQCLTNGVDMSWGESKASPGQRVPLTLAAEPNSLCSYGVVDRSVELLETSYDSLTVDGIFQLIRNSAVHSWDNAQSRYSYDYCREGNVTIIELPPEERSPIMAKPLPIDSGVELPPPLPVQPISSPRDGFGQKRKRSSPPLEYSYWTSHRDALDVFDDSGLFFITDLIVETRPCFKQQIVLRPVPVTPVDGELPPSPQPRPPVGQAGPPESFGSGQGGGGTADFSPETAIVGGEPGDGRAPRTYFPETWLWDLDVIPEIGRSVHDFTLPDTVTEWVGKTVCVHPQKGVGISGKSSITTFKPFFAALTLPPSVKRGEILPVKISVFNYLDTDLPVKVTMDSSVDFDILGETGEEVLSVGERSACVTANEMVTHAIRIKPKEIGDVNLTVTAFVDTSYPQPCGSSETITRRDSLIKPIKVEAEGFPREKTWTKYICSKDLENNVDSFVDWRVESPAGTVEGSERAFVTATGDLLGPSLDNLNGMIQMPTGCGEQNMVLFAPNIYIMQYLEASQQLTVDIVDRSEANMQRGYQRELKYRHPDGSYSAFGKSDDSGSTWLTAFVVKSFAQARQYIFIDQKDLNVSISWLKEQQVNGCFKSVGKVFNKAMKGGIGTDSSSAPLTAYVLMALLEAGEPSQNPDIQQAFSCLLKQRDTWSTYTRAITSYALALAKHPDAEEVLQQLLQEAKRTSASISWEAPAGTGKGVLVEIAGYAVLAMMTIDPVRFDPDAFKVVKWISSTRNGQGGFISTQDTVVALQALATYSSTIEQGGSNLTVTVKAKDLQHSFRINEKNKIVQQLTMLPSLPSTVSLDMIGQGCALMQAVLLYNVPTPDVTDAFSLRVDTRTAPDKKCVTKRIEACAAYLLPDKISNMAILEVNLVSGYVPVKEDLKQVVNETQAFKRFDVNGSKISFYIDEFTSEELCVSFKVIREVDVENAKPGRVQVYDYYQPEFALDQSYVLPPVDECYKIFGPLGLPAPI